MTLATSESKAAGPLLIQSMWHESYTNLHQNARTCPTKSCSSIQLNLVAFY